MLIRLFQHTTICWGLGLRRVMSRTLGDDRRRTASVFVPPARNRDRARIGGTCSPRTSGTRPGTPGRPLRWRTEAETGEESWERMDEALRDTTPSGLLKQPDKHKPTRVKPEDRGILTFT